MEPEGEKLHLLREEFASVASCDASVAQHYLAENDWEMEVRCFSFALSLEPRAHEAHSCVSVFQRALNSYFESPVEEGALKFRPESEPKSW